MACCSYQYDEMSESDLSGMYRIQKEATMRYQKVEEQIGYE